ncbi:hypothetical protein JMJ56_30765 [Belnapia sp. T18]|uniref:ParD-like antitoxin of type II toxin-antitoxin system n=1 Tax=Belnapia arida TaxID=2804533 RepID=A0ABS1UCE4_9PROT|nr:hypothetical protein [Belnapia arida]MBL6082356.1 hypothetical protein [Belnapia arida]
MTDARGTISLKLEILAAATQAARVNHCSVEAQIERWARLGRALEMHSAFSSSEVEAAVGGSKTVEELSSLERVAFFERISEIFQNASAHLVAAYASLSHDPNMGTTLSPREPSAD